MRFNFLIFYLFFNSVCWSQSDTMFLINKETIYFDYDKSNIKSDQALLLDNLFGKIKLDSSHRISIAAHTDLNGSQSYNRKLSERRANAVKKYLEERGVNNDQISVSFFGEEQPLSTSTTDESHQKNRRATLSILEIKKGRWIYGQSIDKQTRSGIQSTIKMHSKYWEDSIQSDQQGNFKLFVPDNEVIGLDIVAEGYLLKMEMMKTNNSIIKNPLQIELDKIGVGEKFDLNRLFFVGDKDLLLDGSFNILPLILEFMTSNPEICISINGHINLPNTNKTKINTHYHDLSIARSRRVFKYLETNGISSDRMVYKGFGNWEMLYPTARIEHYMAKNRRVEILISDCEEIKTTPNDTISTQSHFYYFEEQVYTKKQ